MLDTIRLPQPPRDYQEKAIVATLADLEQGLRPIVSAATGAGKTTIIAEALRRLVDPYTQRGLVIGHTEEIIYQLYERIVNQFGGALDQYYGFMKPGIGMVMGDRDDPAARIIVATRQSLHPKRLEALLAHGAFDVIIVDEAHHAIDDGTYADIIHRCEQANPKLKRFGVTATASRSDREALGSLWSNICFEWTIKDGIETGYLSPVTRLKIQTKVDLSAVRHYEGDYQQKQLASALEANNWLDLCVQAYEMYIAPTGRHTLAFLPSVEMSRHFAASLVAAGHTAAHVDGETPKAERAQLLKDYAAGKIATLSNFGVLTEGLDIPSTDAIFLGRPTRSRTLFTQMLGRGLRLAPNKKYCLLVDMTIFDVKALEAGTLLGKIKTCPKCDAEVWSFLKFCPACNHEFKNLKICPCCEKHVPAELPVCPECGCVFAKGSREESGESDWHGKELVAEQSGLFENTVAAWHMAEDGSMSCALDFGMGSLLIAPPEDGSTNYYLWRVPNSGKVKFVSRNDDVASLIRSADEAARALGGMAVKDNATWRKKRVSVGQIAALKKMGVVIDPNATSGEASEMIAHMIARNRLRSALMQANASPQGMGELLRS